MGLYNFQGKEGGIGLRRAVHVSFGGKEGIGSKTVG